MLSLTKNRSEILRAIRNKKYEVTDTGIYIPSLKAGIGGYFETTINGRDPQVDGNIIPTQGLNLVLDSLMPGGAGQQWYVGLFSTNTTPLDTLTGANWVLAQTEFTGYDEANRVDFDNSAAAAGVLSNDASRAEFTINTAATIYGGALVSAQAKSSILGSILACAKFAVGRAVVDNDTLQVKYTLSVTSGA